MADAARVVQQEPVEVVVPATGEHLRIVRLTAASIGATCGLDVEQLDDLRIAIDELCTMLIGHAPPNSRLQSTLQADGGRLSIDGQLAGRIAGLTIDPVSRLILDELDVDWSSAAPHPSFHLAAPPTSADHVVHRSQDGARPSLPSAPRTSRSWPASGIASGDGG